MGNCCSWLRKNETTEVPAEAVGTEEDVICNGTSVFVMIDGEDNEPIYGIVVESVRTECALTYVVKLVDRGTGDDSESTETIQIHEEFVLPLSLVFEESSSTNCVNSVDNQRRTRDQTQTYQRERILEYLRALQPSEAEELFKTVLGEQNICSVCKVERRERVIVPCGHVCLCASCAEAILQQQENSSRVCPICRTEIERINNFFMA